MSNYYSVQIKRGTKEELNSVQALRHGELAWITDELELYIGTPSGNRKVTHKSELGDMDFSGLQIIGNDLSSIIRDQHSTIEDIRSALSLLPKSMSGISKLIPDFNSAVQSSPGVINVDTKSTINYPKGFVATR